MDYVFLKNRNFDVDGAIERFAGKSDLYEKYIRLFMEEHSFFQLEDAVKKLDYAVIPTKYKILYKAPYWLAVLLNKFDKWYHR